MGGWVSGVTSWVLLQATCASLGGSGGPRWRCHGRWWGGLDGQITLREGGLEIGYLIEGALEAHGMGGASRGGLEMRGS